VFSVLRGNQSGSAWSDPKSWWNNTVPAGGSAQEVLLTASSFENLGTAANPFVADEVIGVTPGLTFPPLTVGGFLHARDIIGLSELQILPSGGVTTGRDLIAVRNVDAHDGGDLLVGGSLIGVGAVNISFGSTVEVGHGLGNTTFSFGIGGATLIVDGPARQGMANKLLLGPGNGGPTIEFGRLQFDAVDFIPSAPGAASGRIALLDHGQTVYQLSNVTETAKGTLSVGLDAETGHDFISYHY
jgi:hypothetical protein